MESPERLLDETSLFLHRVVTELPADKQQMIERLHRSDEDLVGRVALLVDDDARNIFALARSSAGACVCLLLRMEAKRLTLVSLRTRTSPIVLMRAHSCGRWTAIRR